jgi:outer membrane protein OmpA-like peptidoglycan-associated protein
MKYTFTFFFLLCGFFGFSQQKIYDEIYFNSGSDVLSAASINSLDSLINKIPLENKLVISITGYCDSVGNENFNYNLSIKRANSVKTFFINKNIKTDSLLIKGVGETKPKYSATDWGKNRRVEIYVKAKPLVKKVDTTKSVLSNFIDTASVGSTMALENITFYPGEDVPMPESYKTLDELYSTLNENPTLEICIEGHICCAKIDTEGMSWKRAKAVYKYLVSKGIDKARLSSKGFGHSQPLTLERNETERQKNRRVEIRILKK